MRRLKEFALFSILFVSCGFYLFWCARPYIFTSKEIYAPGISEDVVETVKLWAEEQEVFGPEQFEWSIYKHHLMNPAETKFTPIFVNLNGGYHNIFHPGKKIDLEIEEVWVLDGWNDDGSRKIVIQYGHTKRGVISPSNHNNP